MKINAYLYERCSGLVLPLEKKIINKISFVNTNLYSMYTVSFSMMKMHLI